MYFKYNFLNTVTSESIKDFGLLTTTTIKTSNLNNTFKSVLLERETFYAEKNVNNSHIIQKQTEDNM